MSAPQHGAAARTGGGPSTATAVRVGAVCGVAFTTLTVVASAIVPPPPESDGPPGGIRDHLVEHAGGLSLSTALVGIATMAVVGFFALVHSRLHVTDDGSGLIPAAFLVAVCVSVASTMVGLVVQAALVHQIAPAVDDSSLVAFYALWERIFHTAPAMGTAIALLAVSATGPRGRALPRWATASALVVATLMLIDVVEDLATTGTNLGPLGAIAFGLFTVWVAGVSVAAWRHPAPVTAADTDS